MSRPISPVPVFRITLFYGPDAVEAGRVLCVFNVKKRSWKAGVQIAVEMHEAWIRQFREQLGVSIWLEELLSPVAAEEQASYRTRAEDLFVQEICLRTLELAVERLPQKNGRLTADTYHDALQQGLLADAAQLKARLAAQLDLAG